MSKSLKSKILMVCFIVLTCSILLGTMFSVNWNMKNAKAESQITEYYAVIPKGVYDQKGIRTINAPAQDAKTVTIEISRISGGGTGRYIGIVVGNETTEEQPGANLEFNVFYPQSGGVSYTFDLDKKEASLAGFKWTVENPTYFGLFNLDKISDSLYGTFVIKAYDDKGTDLGVQSLGESFSVGQNLVTFDTDGGTAIDPIAVNDNVAFALPLSPVKDDHVFSAWYLDENLTELFEEGMTVTENTTLYAKWIADSQITEYYAVTQKGVYDQKGIITMNTPAQDAKTVTIEISRISGGGTGRYIGIVVGNETTEEQPGANLEFNVFYPQPGGVSYTFDLEKKEASLAGFKWTVENPTYFGLFNLDKISDSLYGTYIIKAYDDKGTDLGIQALDGSFSVGQNLVTFDTDGGTAIDPIAVNDNVAFALPLSPVKDDHVFSAWYLDENLTEPFNEGMTVTENTTLYAKWISISSEGYTVKKYAMSGYYDYPQSLVSRFAPDPKAQYVTMEYTVLERNTETLAKQLGIAVANTNNVRWLAYQNISEEWLNVGTQTESYKHIITFDIKEGSAKYTILKNNTESVMYLSDTFTPSEYSHYGFTLQNSGLEAILFVKCYDNTGKDLGVVAANGGWYIYGALQGDGNRLTDFSNDDFLITGGVCQWYEHSYQEMSLDNSRIYTTVADSKLIAKGAKGNVLVIKNPDRQADINGVIGSTGTFGIQFGTGLTKSDIDKGGTLVIRTWSENANYLQYGGIYSIDNGFNKVDIELIQNIATKNGDNFISWELTNEQLKAICDEEGNFNGFQLTLPASGPNDYTIYIDEIYYKIPVTVELKDENGSSLGSVNVYSGEALPDGIKIPEKSGYLALGWSETQGGYDIYDTDAIGFDEEVLTLYACYAKELDNPSEIIGVYANAETGKYFELTIDGKVNCLTGAVNYVKYKAAQNVIVFDNTIVCSFSNDVIIIDSIEYKKQTTVYTVIYNVLGNEYQVLKVPKGYKAINLEYDNQDYIFSGWQNEGVQYTFGIVETDLVLNANVQLNEISDSDYSSFENSYYNNETGVIYILRKDASGVRILIKVQNGQATELGVYQITVTNKMLNNGSMYQFNVSEKDGYVNSLVVDGKNYWRFDQELKFVIHYNDSEETEHIDTITIGKDENYILEKPQDPTRDGYIFKGWITADGKEYTFNQTITETTEIYAVWEKINASQPIETKSPIGAIVLTSASVVIILASVAMIIIKGKKKNG